ncbi:hypothetical protein ACFQX4_14450 [Roseomonas sp. GCM10028921]
MPRRGALVLALLLAASAAPALAQGGDPSFNLVNRSGTVIQELYVSSAQVQSWGGDLLGRDVLPSGRSFPVRLPQGQCVNDLRVVYEGGRSEERRGIDTCRLSEVVFGETAGRSAGPGSGRGPAPSGETGNPSFNLVNRSNRTIQVLRASPSAENSWGEDRLGSEVVPPGGRFAVRLPLGDCTYDLRVEYDDRGAEERRGVNLCNLADVTFP